jgi:hypothetical protein
MGALKMISRVGPLRNIPVARLIAVAEIVMLVRTHFLKLAPDERRRFVQLVVRGRGRPSRLTAAERDELAMLVLKADPRAFAGTALRRLSPIRVPGGKKRRQR